MKILQKFLNNKTGIIFVISHWIVLFFLLPFLADMRGGINWKVSLALTVIMSDLPAILLAAILWFPVYVAFEDKTGFWSGMFFTSFFTITFQWLFVGKVIYNTFSQTESKLTSLSLTDD